jgi:hypothetical protein
MIPGDIFWIPVSNLEHKECADCGQIHFPRHVFVCAFYANKVHDYTRRELRTYLLGHRGPLTCSAILVVISLRKKRLASQGSLWILSSDKLSHFARSQPR